MASFVDVSDLDKTPSGSSICLDANVLYFLFFPDFRTLRQVDGNAPDNFKVQLYTAWIQRAIENECTLVASFVTVGEFLNTVEFAVLEREWRLRNDGNFLKRYIKEQRAISASCRTEEISAYYQSLQKKVNFLPHQNLMNTPEKSVQLWIDSECDFFDAVLVEHSALYRIDHILTDDADFRFEKIPYVFTANRRLL